METELPKALVDKKVRSYRSIKNKDVLSSISFVPMQFSWYLFWFQLMINPSISGILDQENGLMKCRVKNKDIWYSSNRFVYIGKMIFGRLMVSLKMKLKSLKMKKPVVDDDCSWNSYDKIEKSESMRVEIRSKKARKLIEETLKVADSPKATKSYAF
ncbi:hypothetical protein OSB04_000241 [Centaurea solstitialis]|uniref:Uncharacterized protein n=1 Tax=Centaurea solstitialis TaxID=347529 RepID=A0AA38WRZ9_9ASTR|nr:hypothetical protein OSB04_000241 [Centaurea solstitialis]